MPELHELTAEQIAAAVARGEATAVAVVQACLERVRRVDPAISAYLLIREADALDEAAELDRRRAAGEALGPLAGVPVALKDNLSLTGGQVSCGSRVLEGCSRPARDCRAAFDRCRRRSSADQPRRVRQGCRAGSAFHPTRNPWDVGMVPGGSSGGSAAAVAAATIPRPVGHRGSVVSPPRSAAWSG